MTAKTLREQVVEMLVDFETGDHDYLFDERAQKVISLITEACAKVADERADYLGDTRNLYDAAAASEVREIAQRIRSLAGKGTGE